MTPTTRVRFAVLGLGTAVLAGGCADLLGMDMPTPTPREQTQREIKTLQESKDAQERAGAARSLGRLKAPEGVPVLIAALRDPDPGVRGRAAEVLGAIPDAAAQSVPVLRDAVGKEPSAPVRVDMAWALNQLRADAGDWVPALRSGLAAPDTLTRYNAALGLIGRAQPGGGLPGDLRRAGHPVRQAGVRVRAAVPRRGRARGDQRSTAGAPPAGRPPAGQRRAAGRRRHQPRALQADPDAGVRENAAISLWRIGHEPGQGASVGPPLAEALKDPAPQVRRAAADAFESMSQAPRTTIAVLTQLLRDPAAEVRAAAAFGLTGFIPPAHEAVPALTAAFTQETETKVRVSIARTLGSIGPGAREAVPVLRTALRDPDADVRDAAAEALSLIERR